MKNLSSSIQFTIVIKNLSSLIQFTIVMKNLSSSNQSTIVTKNLSGSIQFTIVMKNLVSSVQFTIVIKNLSSSYQNLFMLDSPLCVRTGLLKHTTVEKSAQFQAWRHASHATRRSVCHQPLSCNRLNICPFKMQLTGIVLKITVFGQLLNSRSLSHLDTSCTIPQLS